MNTRSTSRFLSAEALVLYLAAAKLIFQLLIAVDTEFSVITMAASLPFLAVTELAIANIFKALKPLAAPNIRTRGEMSISIFFFAAA